MIPYMRGSGILDSTWCQMCSVGKQNLTTCLGLALFKGQNSSRLPRPQVRDTDCAVFSAGAVPVRQKDSSFSAAKGGNSSWTWPWCLPRPSRLFVLSAQSLSLPFLAVLGEQVRPHSAATSYCTVITGRADCTVRHVTYQ